MNLETPPTDRRSITGQPAFPPSGSLGGWTAACLAGVLLILWAASPAVGGQAFVLGGVESNSEAGETPLVWEAAYEEDFSRYFGWGLSWLNEGNIRNHKRDGAILQLRVHSEVADRRISLSAGLGPYGYCDTEPANGTGYMDVHGFGAALSVGATWHIASTRWLLQLRGNHVWTNASFDSNSLLLGVGYELAPSAWRSRPQVPSGRMDRAARNEITAFAGMTILNSMSSQKSPAGALEYRRNVFPWLDWTCGYLYEGSPGPIERSGIASEIWPVRAFFEGRLSLGVGLGAYLAVDKHRKESGEDENTVAAGLFSFSAGYRLGPHLLTRATWSRTVTDDDRDTDVLLVGLGYRF